MKHIKRVITIFFIFIIMAASLVPSFRCSHFVFADSSTDQWNSITTNQELADAFRYYCKSRNLVIDGSVADALTSFTTNSFNTICNTLGIDITALQAHLKRSTDSNGKVQFLFDQFGVTAYNRIFAEFLQNNNLEVGDEVDDKELYSGQYFVDKDGNGCLIFKYTSSSNVNKGIYSAKGTPYRFSGDDLISLTNSNSNHYSVVCHLSTATNWTLNSYKIGTFDSGNYTYELIYNTYADAGYGFRWYELSHWRGYPNDDRVEYKGYPIIYLDTSSGKYYVGAFVQDILGKTKKYGTTFTQISFDANYQPANTVIFITTNNNTINNNTYNDNKQTVINNDGDVYNYDYDDDDPPINPPSGGGGDDPPINPPTDPDDWGIDLPDLNIDWLLTGKENKFPFNIPFNIILTLSLLNAEPEAPHFEGTIDLGVYQWDYEIDLEQFDPVAEVCRNFEFIAFLIGLMLLTKRLIWG